MNVKMPDVLAACRTIVLTKGDAFTVQGGHERMGKPSGERHAFRQGVVRGLQQGFNVSFWKDQQAALVRRDLTEGDNCNGAG